MKYSILAVFIAVGLVLLMSFTKKRKARKKENAVIDYIKENPDKSSIKIVRNGEVIVDYNSDMMMPLASTVKIIVAIEFAEQAAAGIIDPDEVISFDLLDQFYVPGTDGGAHMAWFKSLKGKIVEDGIRLRDIARGMIMYSSNANTEWLCMKLGLENVNSRIEALGIKDHSEIYYIVSALFVGRELYPELKLMELADSLKSVPMKEYLEKTSAIHDKLLLNVGYKDTLGELNLGVQKVWSDRLPASTTSEYVGLVQKINSRTYFSEEVQSYLSEVLESMMESPENQKWLEHSGVKGGSTAFVLTEALYAHDKKGNTTEMAYFLNDIGFLENMKLQRSMVQFDMAVLSNPEFLDLLKEELGQ